MFCVLLSVVSHLKDVSSLYTVSFICSAKDKNLSNSRLEGKAKASKTGNKTVDKFGTAPLPLNFLTARECVTIFDQSNASDLKGSPLTTGSPGDNLQGTRTHSPPLKILLVRPECVTKDPIIGSIISILRLFILFFALFCTFFFVPFFIDFFFSFFLCHTHF